MPRSRRRACGPDRTGSRGRPFEPALIVTGVLASAVVLTLVVAAVEPAGSGARPAGAAQQRAQADSAAKTQARLPSAMERDPVADIGGAEVNTPEIMALPRCSASDLTLRVSPSKESYRPKDRPVFVALFDRRGGQDCRVDLGRRSSVATVTAKEQVASDGGKYIWSSGDCPAQKVARWVAITADGPVTETFRWNRGRSTSDCEPPGAGKGERTAAGQAEVGAYFVTVALGGLDKRAEFRLDPSAFSAPPPPPETPEKEDGGSADGGVNAGSSTPEGTSGNDCIPGWTCGSGGSFEDDEGDFFGGQDGEPTPGTTHGRGGFHGGSSNY